MFYTEPHGETGALLASRCSPALFPVRSMSSIRPRADEPINALPGGLIRPGFIITSAPTAPHSRAVADAPSRFASAPQGPLQAPLSTRSRADPAFEGYAQ